MHLIFCPQVPVKGTKKKKKKGDSTTSDLFQLWHIYATSQHSLGEFPQWLCIWLFEWRLVAPPKELDLMDEQNTEA